MSLKPLCFSGPHGSLGSWLRRRRKSRFGAGLDDRGRFPWVWGLIVFVVCGLKTAIQCCGQSPIPENFPRWDWQPTIAREGATYAGDAACTTCHAAEATTQPSTLMAKALRSPAESEVIRQHPRMTFQKDRYSYEIRREGSASVYSVSDGKRTIVVPILAAVGYGLGAVGQTFLLQYEGYLLESEVTYYDAIGGLDVTPGHQNTTPAFLEGALGIRLPWHDQKACFGCHATAAATDTKLQLGRMSPGIRCEGCHGAGTAHVTAVKDGRLDDLHIFNPGSLGPTALNDFCGSCHRTALAEKLLGIRGVQNVRFQGYRLARSRCYGDDRRITCTACHNPHEPLVRNAGFYDSKCLACHASKDKPAATRVAHVSACPVAKENCTSCHMPKIEIPGTHSKFSDHWVRVVKAGSAYPE
jgi:hypothetical protein